MKIQLLLQVAGVVNRCFGDFYPEEKGANRRKHKQMGIDSCCSGFEDLETDDAMLWRLCKLGLG